MSLPIRRRQFLYKCISNLMGPTEYIFTTEYILNYVRAASFTRERRETVNLFFWCTLKQAPSAKVPLLALAPEQPAACSEPKHHRRTGSNGRNLEESRICDMGLRKNRSIHADVAQTRSTQVVLKLVSPHFFGFINWYTVLNVYKVK